MKILVLIHEFPPIGGGGGRVAEDIARGLVARGHVVQVIAPYLRGLPFESSVSGIAITRMPSLRKSPYSADLLAMLGYIFAGFLIGLWKIWRFKPDLIHVHFAVPAGALAWILHKLTGTPYILTTHLGDVPGGVPDKTAGWFRWVFPLTPRIWQDAARVVAISEYTKQLALKHYPVEICVIPNGIDIYAFNRGKELSVHSPPRIIFAGRFVPQKNLGTFVEVLNELQDLNWDCILIGDGWLFDTVKAQVAQCHLEKRVKFTGWLEPDDVIAQMYDADLLFMPSLSEGISLSALQALATGLAIVASRVGGMGDMVVDGVNGYLHVPEDKAGFAQSLRTLLKDPDLLMRARMQSLEIVKRFDLKRIVDLYESIFLEVYLATRKF